MKAFLIGSLMFATILMSFFALTTTKAKADMLCYVECINYKNGECYWEWREACIIDQVFPSEQCGSFARGFCEAYNCQSRCSICPI